MPAVIRPAEAADASFLVEMLVAAAFWRPAGPRGSVAQVMAQPGFAHYVADWPRHGDMGVVATDDVPVGAAWLRYFPATDPGFGFVAADVPEVTIGVVQDRRGQGIGRQLLEALVDGARQSELAAMSLSVEPDNHARRLYERMGFHQVATSGGSLTLLLRL